MQQIATAARFFESSDKGYAGDTVHTFEDFKGRLHWARSTAYEDSHGLKWHVVVIQRVDCPPNYAADNVTASCVECERPFTARGGHYSASCKRLCMAGYYMDIKGTCSKCKRKGMVCNKIGTTLENMRLESGWYRFSSESAAIYRCPYDAHCIGNSTCSASSEGALCTSCRTGYYFHADQKQCVDCEGYSPGIADILGFIFLFAILAFSAVFIYVLCTSNASPEEKPSGYDGYYGDADGQNGDHNGDVEMVVSKSTSSVNHKQEAGVFILRLERKLRCLYTFFQLAAGFAFNLDMSYPQPFMGAVNALTFINIDIFTAVPLACSFEPDYLDTLLVANLSPIAICLVLLGLHWRHHHQLLKRPQKLKEHMNQDLFFQGFLLVLFIVLPSASSKSFAVFRCNGYETDADGNMDYYLAVDYSINCSSTRYEALFATSLVMMLIYPIGIPLIFGVLLWNDRHELMNPDLVVILNRHKGQGVSLLSAAERNEGWFWLTFFFSNATRGMASTGHQRKKTQRFRSGRHLQDTTDADAKWDILSKKHRLSFLIDPYERRVYWYEVVECCRRVCLSGVLLLFGSGNIRQIIAGCFITLAYIRVGALYNPYLEDEESILAEMCNWQLFLILFISLLIRLDATPPFVGALLLMVLFASFAIVVMLIFGFGVLNLKISLQSYWEAMSEEKKKHLEAHEVQKGEERGVELSTTGNEGRSPKESVASTKSGGSGEKEGGRNNPLHADQEFLENTTANFSQKRNTRFLFSPAENHEILVEQNMALNEDVATIGDPTPRWPAAADENA